MASLFFCPKLLCEFSFVLNCSSAVMCKHNMKTTSVGDAPVTRCSMVQYAYCTVYKGIHYLNRTDIFHANDNLYPSLNRPQMKYFSHFQFPCSFCWSIKAVRVIFLFTVGSAPSEKCLLYTDPIA